MLKSKDVPTSVLFVRESSGFRFEWLGGEYINVFSRVKKYRAQREDLWVTNTIIRPPNWYSHDDVINVWDNDKGKPRIPVTKNGFDKEIDKWLIEQQSHTDS